MTRTNDHKSFWKHNGLSPERREQQTVIAEQNSTTSFQFIGPANSKDSKAAWKIARIIAERG